MAPPPSSSQAPSAVEASNNNATDWIQVTWMPHTTLSQTSQVGVMIRSAHLWRPDNITLNGQQSDEWSVRVGIYGIGGQELCPLSTSTNYTALHDRRPKSSSASPSVPEHDNDAEHEPKSHQHESAVIHRVGRATHDCCWEQYLQLVLRWRDLPRDAYLLLEVLTASSSGPLYDDAYDDGDDEPHVLYRGTLPLFSRYGKLQTGFHRIALSTAPLSPARNYGLYDTGHDDDDDEQPNSDDDAVWQATRILDEIARMERRTVSFYGQTPRVPWLDALQQDRCREVIAEYLDGSNSSQSLQQRLAQHRNDPDYFDPLLLIPVIEYENEHDNPVEDKYRTLAHDLLRGLVDPALKPDRAQRHQLAALIDSPSHHLTRDQKDLLWRFRFSLVDNRKALTKFLLAVDWTVESEVVQAAELLEQWRQRSPIQVSDALKLLDKDVAFSTNLVRSYAIDTLAAAPDSELRLYLLQLVQALKFENVDDSKFSTAASGQLKTDLSRALPPQTAVAAEKKSKEETPTVSSLANFLISRAANNIQLATFLYWYIKVELSSSTHGARYRDVFDAMKAKLGSIAFSDIANYVPTSDQTGASVSSRLVDSVSKLGSSVRHSESLASSPNRHDKKEPNLNSERSVWDVLEQQDAFVSGVLDVQLRCRETRGKKDAKELQLRAALAKEGFNKKDQRQAIPLPSSPEMLVNGVRPDTAKMFKSALYPALLELNVEGVLYDTSANDASTATSSAQADQAHEKSPSASSVVLNPRDEHKTHHIPLHLATPSFKVIFKTGDDLRQDQLVIMMTQLMDGLLQHAALNLCLTPYSVMALSPTSGLVEFVDGALPISQVLAQYNYSIMQFFQSTSPQANTKYGVIPDVINTYVRSCAGACVVTYLLGVGDRHLDNILLQSSGHFFHIDFGFAFGRDPKPLPPAFRLTREMVDGMGGMDSTEYQQFCSLACQAFGCLRKSAGLILNLLHLMTDAGIEDLSNHPGLDADAVLAKVEERFRLDLSDEQAERYFAGLINDCLAALAPRVMDAFHAFSVARR